MACAGNRGARLSVRRAASAGESKGSWRRGAPPSLRGSPAPPPQKRWRPERRRARARSPVGSRAPPALLPPPANTQETGQRRKSSELQIFARLGKFGEDFGHRLVAWRLAGGACLGRKLPKQIRCGALVAACKRVESIELYLRVAPCGSAHRAKITSVFSKGRGAPLSSRCQSPPALSRPARRPVGAAGVASRSGCCQRCRSPVLDTGPPLPPAKGRARESDALRETRETRCP